MTLETPEPSDQLPEEGPEETAPDAGGSSSESAEDQARDEADVREGEEQATGDRKSAG
jgi:hypothetical protein